MSSGFVMAGYPPMVRRNSRAAPMSVTLSDRAVGADVERLDRANPVVLRRCFQTGEADWIRSQPDLDRAFYRIWTRKESSRSPCR